MNRAVTARMKRRWPLTRIVKATKTGASVDSSDSNETILSWRVFVIRSNAGTAGEQGFDLLNRKAVFLTLRPVPVIPIEPADPQIHRF